VSEADVKWGGGGKNIHGVTFRGNRCFHVKPVYAGRAGLSRDNGQTVYMNDDALSVCRRGAHEEPAGGQPRMPAATFGPKARSKETLS
jgi:hypothetical protein